MAKKGLRYCNKINKKTQEDFKNSNKEITPIIKADSKVIVPVKYTIEQNKDEVSEITPSYLIARLYSVAKL